MGKLYAVYGIASGLLVSLALSVEVFKDYRTLSVIFNVVVTSYLCLVNGWFRDRLFGLSRWLSERENL